MGVVWRSGGMGVSGTYDGDVCSFQVDGSMFNHCVRVVLPREVIASYWSCELEQEEVGGGVEALSSQMAVKWVLNAVSTGAHIIKGKVLRNRMVDLHLRYEASVVVQLSNLAVINATYLAA